MTDARVEFRVKNLDCESDAAKIVRGLAGAPGVIALRVYAKAAKVGITYAPVATSPDLLRDALDSLGFPAQQGLKAAELPKPWRNPKVVTSILSGLLLLAGWLGSQAGVPHSATVALYIASLLVGGYYFGREGIEDLVFGHQIGIELLMTIAAVVATLLGALGEGAMLAFLYSISEAAEGYTEAKTRSAIKALMNLAPKTALVRRDVDGAQQEMEIPVEELGVGDVFIVKPGQAVATDGEVLLGASSMNQAPVTGESVPVEKGPGDAVFAGSINGEGALDVRTTRAFAENTIARIIHMVEEAQERKGKSERFIERFGHWYSPSVLAVGVLIAIVPPLLFTLSWAAWLTRATVFIVAAAPCALVISIPITLVAALGTAARKGVLIKGGGYVEELAKIRVVALDKTGTITSGEPEVIDFVTIAPDATNIPRPPSQQVTRQVTRSEVLAMTAGVEARSQHPLARAIVRFAEAEGAPPVQIEDFQSLTGAAAVARIDGSRVFVGSPVFFESNLGVRLGSITADINHLREEGKTVVLVGNDNSVFALFAIRDTVRPNARRAIEALHAARVRKVVMLTGDNELTAQAIARDVGIDKVYADLKPEDKASRVRELADHYGHVAMVGDGMNDAPALAEATVGIAMGAAGTDVALETADVALMADDLEKLVYALQLAKRNQRVVRQNLALSVVVISVLVVGALLGRFSLPVAVVGHELSEFLVIASGLRMLKG